MFEGRVVVDNDLPLDRSVGAVHGRFQPIHNGHLKYLTMARRKCDFLWIGVTQCLRSRLVNVEGAGAHRATEENNPLTYFERYNLIKEALPEAGFKRSSFAIVPFPLECPNALEEFIPAHIPMYTTVCEDWNRFKIARLRQRGYLVNVLWEGPKDVSGQQVRGLIAARDPVVQYLVPPATLRAISSLRLWERV